MKHIIVFGADDFNLEQMRALPYAGEYKIQGMRTADGGQTGPEIPLRTLLADAHEELQNYPEPIDAIVGYWDFPVSTLLPLLREPFGLPSPSLESVLKCEHKYWCRLEQKPVLADYIPDFCPVNPFAEDPLAEVDLAFPFWLKPVKSVSSHLGFKVRNVEEFNHAIAVIRRGIHRFAERFNELLGLADVPEYIRKVDGYHCIAESIISEGAQCTLEGYVHRGEVVTYGVIDSMRSGLHRSSFSRYQYPSKIPRAVREEMASVAARFMRRIGYDNSPFNVEFFWDEKCNSIWLLEINTRISKSHCPLFQRVDGVSHHKVMIDVAMGRRPDFPYRQGRHRYAAKFMWRVTEDAVVGELPTREELAALHSEYSVDVHLNVRPGMKLSQLEDQDSYSYELAEIYIGGDSQQDLLRKWKMIKSKLNINLLPVY